MSKKPLKSTDKRRLAKSSRSGVKSSETGSASPLASLFNDRRRPNGAGKKAY